MSPTTLTPGTRLGPFEILSSLGEGGMGAVYRARDTKLGREVAIKVLLPAVANDADRLARFQREARVLASLNHPHIAAIYGLEDADGTKALVLELVEGPTLADRIAQGAIPLDEGLSIAKQIAEALEAAHEQGIIHRDLKPANIKVRPDGTVKVLDFGLAKAMDPAGASSANAMNSPTLSMHATQAGIILGTAGYMSPEQARGGAVDKRSDLWAFGVVFYEMLTGARLFDGNTVSDTLAQVLMKEPNWTAVPLATPVPIRKLLRRCLEKDRKRRLPDAADIRLEIEDALTAPPENASPVRRTLSRRALPFAVTAGLGLASGAAVVLVSGAPWRSVPHPSLHLSTQVGAEDVALGRGAFGTGAVLSPDGNVLAFRAVAHGTTQSSQLYVRRLNQLQATPLAGTDQAAGQFFSPDGQWVAFFAGGKLKKVSLSGGSAAVALCDAPDPRGGTWADDGTIVFTANTRPGATLMRVSQAGGVPEPLTPLAGGESTQRWSQVLPGGHAVLFTSGRVTGAFDDADLVVQPLPAGARKIVLRGGYHGHYTPSGHLVYMHDGALFAAAFDLQRLEVTGQSSVVLPHVVSNSLSGTAEFDVSASGTLVYQPGPSTGGRAPIQWLDHDGKMTVLRTTPADWSNLRFAPDGRRLALEIFGEQIDIWTYEWSRDTLARLTSDPANDTNPVWTPDSRRIVFASTRASTSTPNLYWQRSDGTGDVQRLTESRNQQLPASWHPNGKVLAFEEGNPETKSDLMLLPIEGDEVSGWKPGKPTVFLNTPFSEREPMFSPDGRWLAYSSNESGTSEVYVRPFPGPGGKWQVSTGGGRLPTWSLAKHELFYSTIGNRIMVAPFAVEGDSFRVEKPRSWFDKSTEARGPDRMFDLHPDGERFAFRPAEQAPSGTSIDHVTFIFNFLDELRRIAPAKK